MKQAGKEVISVSQLFVLLIVFEIGSAVIIGIGGEAKKDAWIAVLVAMVAGLLLIQLYFLLLKKKEGKDYFQIMIDCFGKPFSKLLIMAYVIYFLYIATRVLRDFLELIGAAIFSKTPIEFISLTIMFSVAYVIYMGIEVLARSTEIFFPYVVFFLLFVGLGIFLTGAMEIDNVRPLLEDGIGPIIKAVFPTMIGFPFGEVIVFTLLFPYVSKVHLANRVTSIAILISGLVISYTTFIQITTLGADMKSRSTFPMLSAAGDVSLLNFIERIDILIVFIMMFGAIVKVSIFFYGGMKGLGMIFNKSYRHFVFPFSTLIAYFAMIISKNYSEHIEEGLKIVPKFMHVTFQMVIPVLVLIVVVVKNWRKKQNTKHGLNDIGGR